MSHVDIVDIVIQSKRALKKAVISLGGEYLEGQETFKWWGYSVGDHPLPEGYTEKELGKCEDAIKFPNCKYEIGVVPDKKNEGAHTLIADFYMTGGLERQVGQGAWKLKQAYARERTIEVAEEKGYAYEIENLPDRQRILVYQ